MKKLLTTFFALLLITLTMIILASCTDDPCQHRDADDNSICDKCEESYKDGTDVHVHYFTQQNTHSKHLVSTGDCVNPSIYYYSCYCGETGTETFTEGGGGLHSEESDIAMENVVNATCSEDGSYDKVYSCKTCHSVTNRQSYISPATGNHQVENGACTVCNAKESDPRLEYALNSDGEGYTVTGVRGSIKDIVIGSIHNNKNVTAVSYRAFFCNLDIESVTIYEGVEYIGSEAFTSCVNLKKVILPNSITEIQTSAFSYCTNLTSISFGENSQLKRILMDTFSECKSLKTITIPREVEYIDSVAFYGCTSLTTVNILEGVEHIGSNAFNGCSSLESITIPASVTYIGINAFTNCTSLTSVTFKNPNGWSYYADVYATNGSAISSRDLANAKTAANLLTNSYYSRVFKRN